MSSQKLPTERSLTKQAAVGAATITAAEPATIRKKIFCGVCEGSCGLEATVRGDDILSLRPDPDHPNTRGFACAKGLAFSAVRDDPDRLLHPLKRQADGSFVKVSWDQALDEIGARMNAIIAEHGTESIGLYQGNSVAWNFGAFLNLFGMAGALKTKHLYSAASIDINGYWLISQLLYGSNFLNPIPDIVRTDFMLCLGANPAVSHGSMANIGRFRDTMVEVTQRGGRVVVVDPRRSETAVLFEHIPIRPNGDVWLLAALLKVIFDEGLADMEALRTQTSGHEILPDILASLELSRAASVAGIPVDQIRQLARDFAAAKSACAYGRCGMSIGPFASLGKYFLDALNIVTGNLDRPGGWCFGRPFIDLETMMHRTKSTGYDRWRTRVDQFPEVAGTSPVVSIPREIMTPGKGRLRVMMVIGANPVTSSPAADELRDAFEQLDLLISQDVYMTETSRLAHYILPPTVWIEREGFPIFTQSHSGVPHAQWVGPTVAPRGDTRDDSWIMDEICRRIGIVPADFPGAQMLGKLGLRATPSFLMDVGLRTGPEGDWYGLRPSGLTRKKLMDNNGAVKLADSVPTGILKKRIFTKGGKVQLDHALIRDEMRRLLAFNTEVDAQYPLSMISLRELRTQNTWLHNIPKLIVGDRVQRLRIHPDDAARFGIEDGDPVEITSRYGQIRVPAARVSEEMMPGSVALPQGWGHTGTWNRAVAVGGAGYNRLTSNRVDSTDLPSGNATVNGIAVRIRSLKALEASVSCLTS
ncbi:MAG: molybdopterin oxidoreductase [Hydrocarboniphaga sp.]|uniref:molybdopterin-containing oxidoreductase family protein n=1 Tax=Hydrocarboniphaga sp. TaxID=2033016 RepID=UPI00262104E9|nr:molybdopterin-dependent oxidoreductase [Hydrocarboniphaga sp.]MDB5971884.1 molybdopterin oxidoreductase [Hydrocarboniphaga sp.]